MITSTEILRFGGAILILLAVVSCSSSGKSNNGLPPYPERTFSSPWAMREQDVERLRLNVAQMALGDDIAHVVALLGPPDLDYTVKKNEKNRFLTYYVTRQRADSPLESDRRVTIALNSENKVKAIFSNVEGIKARNWP